MTANVVGHSRATVFRRKVGSGRQEISAAEGLRRRTAALSKVSHDVGRGWSGGRVGSKERE